MMFNFLKRVFNILLIPPLLFFVNEVKAQCDVFIEPGSVVVTDNGSGVKFTFDITNNSSTDWYGDDLKMYWSLNSGAPIWNIDYSQNVNQPPIGPGETRTIKTPWFDIPNLPSWFPDDPTTAQPWVESMEWPYYNLSFPFQGSWSPMNLRLGSCGLADGAWIYDSDGELYYGPFDTDCPDVNNDAMCDCDLEITSFDPVSLDIEVEVVSHWNCGQPLNGLGNFGSSNTDAVDMIYFGIHVPGWDYQWGCTTGNNHPGWTFTGWSSLNNPNLFLYSGDVFQGNLNNMTPPNSCFDEILSSDTISECREIVLWQINYSQTLNVADGGWAVFPSSGNETQEYPDFSIIDNTILLCGIPDVNGCTDPVASNYNPNANVDDGSCEYLYPDANPGFNLNSTTCLDGTPANIYNITIYNPGDDTLFYYCVEIPELNYDECFNGYQTPPLWIEPGGGQTIAQVTVPEGVYQITINVYEAEGEIEGTFSDNIEVFNLSFNGPNPCPIPGCTDPNANNYDSEANEEDGSCTYDELTLDLGGDILWTPQGNCVNPFYNQSFVVNNTGEGVIDNFSLEVIVETWDGNPVFQGTQDYNVSIDINGSYIVSDFPDIFTGDLNHVTATLSWINELGEIETDTQLFNLILYCWGCTDPEANNYTESEYIFDEVPVYWLGYFNVTPPSPEQIECTYDVVDIALDTVLYNTGCDENGPYWSPTFYLTNEGNVTITELCIVPDILSTPEIDTVCFNNLNILPGETFLQEWPNVYDWGVLSAKIIDVNGESGESWNDFGFDEDVADNMYVQIINDSPDCTEGCTDPNAINYNPNAIIDDGSCQYDVTELDYLDAECTIYCDENGPYYYVTTTFQNTGNVTITDFCAEWNVIGGQENIQCFNGSLEPGEIAELVYGPFYQSGSGVIWVYLQELNGVVLDPQIGFYENITCSLNAEEVCVYGCTDDTANNYDPDADLDDGSCTYDVLGCTDPDAENYNPNANIDDGSCQIGGCTIEQACNYNPDATYNDGSCDFESCVGCTDPEAINYDPIATEDDGSCIYPIYGCTDPEAFNYDPLANTDDGSCVDVVVGCMVPEALNYNPDANISCTPIDECCIFEEGCTDPLAINYNPNAWFDDGSCTYDVLGCTDPQAFNYNPFANIDDGSCQYQIYGCTDIDAINYNPLATVDDGSCIFNQPCDTFEGNVYIPNAFTPDGDGYNEIWKAFTLPDCWRQWNLRIYNRWGNVVWDSENSEDVWIGNHQNGEYYVQNGVYTYKIVAITINGKLVEKLGFVVVIR